MSPDSVVLGDLPQITAREAAQIQAPTHARMHGISQQQYAVLKMQAASAKLPAPKGASQLLIPVPLLPPPSTGAAPTRITAFRGIPERCGRFIPPDMALATGPNFVLQVINGCLSVFDKAGNVQAGFPKSLTSFMLVGSSAQVPPFDPRALFDWVNQRYIVSASHISAKGVSFIDIAVSQSSNPMGGWFIYRFNLNAGAAPIRPPGQFADFPTMGQDRRAIYVAFNAFESSNGTFDGASMLLLPKSAMYAGSGFTFHFLGPDKFTVGNTEMMDSLQPANVMDRSDNPRAEFVVASHNIDAPGGIGNSQCASGCNGLVVWAISNPLFNASGPGPEVSQVQLATANTYSLPPLAEQKGCAAPSATCTLLDTGDTRITGEATYASGSLYAALSTNGTGGGAGAAHFLWFQIRPVLNDNDNASCTGSFFNRCPQIVGASKLNEVCWACTAGQGSGGTGAAYYPTVQPDPEGNVLVVFNYSDNATFPSSAYATNRATQALNTMHDSGFFLQPGSSTYVSLDNNHPRLNRWGDYTAASVDLTPGTRASFWFASESSNAVGNYRTDIGQNAFGGVAQP